MASWLNYHPIHFGGTIHPGPGPELAHGAACSICSIPGPQLKVGSTRQRKRAWLAPLINHHDECWFLMRQSMTDRWFTPFYPLSPPMVHDDLRMSSASARAESNHHLTMVMIYFDDGLMSKAQNLHNIIITSHDYDDGFISSQPRIERMINNQLNLYPITFWAEALLVGGASRGRPGLCVPEQARHALQSWVLRCARWWDLTLALHR